MKALLFLTFSLTASAQPLDLGSRWELFVDEYLVAQKNGVALKLHDPIKEEARRGSKGRTDYSSGRVENKAPEG